MSDETMYDSASICKGEWSLLSLARSRSLAFPHFTHKPNYTVPPIVHGARSTCARKNQANVIGKCHLNLDGFIGMP